MKSFVVGCDNAALWLKESLIQCLCEAGCQVEDIGCRDNTDETPYAAVAESVCNTIRQSGYVKKGLLLCGTGIGMCMAANKMPGIRAAVCHDLFSAERSVLSNNANVICMGERVIGRGHARRLLERWIALEFVDGSSTPKVEAIMALEKRAKSNSTGG